MTTRQKPGIAGIPESATDVALIDVRACAAIGSMSVSWWHAEVSAGRAPSPVIREPRCTRWRLADVRRYWFERADRGSNPAAVDAVLAKAGAASAKASELRAAQGA